MVRQMLPEMSPQVNAKDARAAIEIMSLPFPKTDPELEDWNPLGRLSESEIRRWHIESTGFADGDRLYWCPPHYCREHNLSTELAAKLIKDVDDRERGLDATYNVSYMHDRYHVSFNWDGVCAVSGEADTFGEALVSAALEVADAEKEGNAIETQRKKEKS